MTPSNLRDKRLRRRLLEALDGAKVYDGGGGLGGRTLSEVVDSASPASDRFEDDEHVIRLARDLVNAGLAKETDQRTKKLQRMTLDYLYYAITVSGTALIEQMVEAHPMVEDDRR